MSIAKLGLRLFEGDRPSWCNTGMSIANKGLLKTKTYGTPIVRSLHEEVSKLSISKLEFGTSIL
jgi:hypothetical protein